MDLNNENFRTTLSNIFKIDKKYIVLKQGNWFSPISTAAKPKTWIAYNILKNRPVTLPDFQDGTVIVEDVETDANFIEATKIAEIDLQFVGDKSEELANNVNFWIKRQDVAAELGNYDGKIMANDMTAWSTDYVLDGENTIKAWNVKIFIVWIQKIQTDQIKFTNITLEGGIN